MLNILPIEIAFFDPVNFKLLIIRFLMNLISIVILVRVIYMPINRKREYLFIFVIFNILIFFVSSLLSRVNLDTGFAFGLFAVFSILRYRTKQIPIKEMTFLFISIILATINSMVTIRIGLTEVLFSNIVILIMSYIMEMSWKRSFQNDKIIYYDNIELIKPETEEALLADLKSRTGLDIMSYDIELIDMLRDIAHIRIWYL